MQVEKYLKNYQPTIYQTFVQALENNKLSHAYLLVGNKGVPLLEIATYLAKSILCDSPNPLACDTCITCARIDEGNYPDVMIFDGEKSRIKKGDIERIITNFDKSALERKGIMIYILHLVETMIHLGHFLVAVKTPEHFAGIMNFHIHCFRHFHYSVVIWASTHDP